MKRGQITVELSVDDRKFQQSVRPAFIKVTILWLLLLCSGCVSSYPMKISYTRAATDITVTGLIDADVLGSDDVILIVHRLREALGNLDKVSDYTAEVYAATAPYVGGKLLARLLLKTLPKYAFKLGTYSYGLGQALNQAELAATEYENARAAP